jgi:hypothetical protein
MRARIRSPGGGEDGRMFAWLRRRRLQQDRRRLEQDYLRLLEQARDLQRGGDIQGFAAKTAEAAEAEARLDAWDRAHAAAGAQG